jgi:streptogramin lyase
MRDSLFVAAATSTLLLSGCSEMPKVASTGVVSVPVPGAALRGTVHGGQAPIAGATVYLYAASANGYGQPSVSLLTNHANTSVDSNGNYYVTTDSNGAWSITGDYSCPAANAQVYLYSSGGDPGAGANAAAGLMAGLGSCGNLSAATYVTINEVSTIATAYAIAGYAMDPTHVSDSGTASAVTGISNAFATITNLETLGTGLALAETPAGNGTAPQSKVNTLANIVAACVNSTGPDSTACSTLFANTTGGGMPPTDTAAAAINIAHNPGLNVATLFGLQTASGDFQPMLSAAPSDFTLAITYSGGGLNLPGSLAINSVGEVWVANYFGGEASEFSNTGAPASPSGFPAAGLAESFGITVDAQDSVWITNESSSTGGSGSITHLSSSGQDLSGSGYAMGGIYFPIAVAATSGGDIWVADYGSSTASLLANDGTAISGTSGYAASSLLFTTAVAVDANQNGWFAFEGGVAKVTPAGGVSTFPCCEVPAGIALDQPGNVWVADYGASTVFEISANGALLGQAAETGGVNTPVGIAIDGNGNVWTANYRANSVSELNGQTLQPISPSTGYGSDAGLDGPFGAGIDASGNLWISNAYGNTLTEFVGAAGPVKTPLLGLPAQP